MKLKSYVQGRWIEPSDVGVSVRDATTGAIVATVSSQGIDFGQLLQYARSTGGPALRNLTFHERAARLKALGKRLLELKDEFYAVSYQSGATKADSWIDIDGGIGTMLVFASKGVRELPNSHVYIDGAVERLVEERYVRWSAHICSARGRRGPHQCFQFPCLGNAREAGAGDACRRSCHRETCDRHCLSRRAGRTAHRGERNSARRCPAARLWQPRQPVRLPGMPGPCLIHRLGSHGAAT